MIEARIPFFDRSRADALIEPELVEAFLRVVRSGRYILGREVEALERECAALVGASHAIGVSSGTDALLVALMSLGLRPGDEVVCPAYSFFATAEVILRLGATPVFVDIEASGFGIDPAKVAEAISGKTRAVIVAHLFGQCAAVDAVRDVARGIPIVEDAAQAMGASLAGRMAGTFGALGCFSFFPSKTLGGFGDGGLVVTSNANLAEKIRCMRAHGARQKHQHEELGGNFRLDALQAALIRVKLPLLAEAIERRVAHASRYAVLLRRAGLAERQVTLPERTAGSTFDQYVIRVHGEHVRDQLRSFLADARIPTEVYYPLTLPRQPLFHAQDATALWATHARSPNAETCSREALALPIFPELREDEIELVVSAIAEFLRRADGGRDAR